MPKIKNNSSLLILCLCLMASAAFAQPKINSPYSRIGLGDLENLNYAALNGYGDLSAAFNDFAHSNFRNPASLSFLRTTSFELGLNARYGKLSFKEEEADVWSGNLSYFSLAFPTRNISSRLLDRDKSPIFWGMGFSLQPYSTVGYDVQTTAIEPGVDTIINTYRGTGGTYQLQWAHGIHYKWSANNDSTTHKLAIGASVGYLFGNIENNQAVDFVNLENHYFDLFENDQSIRGLLWNLGLQYEYAFPNKGRSIRHTDRSRLTIGAYGHSSNKININTERIIRRRNLFYPNAALDTLEAGTFTDSLFSGKLPPEFGLGFMYRFRKGKATWKVGADYSMTKWSKYFNDAKGERTGDLQDAYNISFGAEFVPNDYLSVNNYFERIRYRIGAFYGRDPRGGAIVGINESLTRSGITLGLGLPIIIKNESSFVNIAFQLGQLNGGEGAINDAYAKLIVGFTFNDSNWFYKRKFN
ncbi:MAG TPA: hypothetical protein ENJ45_05085 [Phaeodactylibacter sp.]|nr:hypothetical protein [Phaeodactylibacter sp.]